MFESYEDLVCLQFLIFTLVIGKFLLFISLRVLSWSFMGKNVQVWFFMWTTHNSHKDQSFICLLYFIMIEFILWIAFEVFFFFCYSTILIVLTKKLFKTKVGNIITHFETNDFFIKGGGSTFWPKCEINLLCHRSLFTCVFIFLITQPKLWLKNEWLCHI
jgi:hypothetical protein